MVEEENKVTSFESSLVSISLIVGKDVVTLLQSTTSFQISYLRPSRKAKLRDEGNNQLQAIMGHLQTWHHVDGHWWLVRLFP